MKGFFKVFLPPVLTFSIFWAVIKIDSLYHQIRFEHISEGTLHSLMAYFFYFAPLLFLVALLTQFLLVIPIWNRIKNRPSAKKVALIILIVICFIFSVAVSYLMWGSVRYLSSWIRSCLIMISVQLFYWFINVLILHLLDRNSKVIKEHISP
jgi:hypothetical protein